MTDKQPEALRLADKYAERYHDYRMRATHETEHDLKVFRNALESELRRLHEVNAELVEALKLAKDFIGTMKVETKFHSGKQTLVTDMRPIQILFSTIVLALAKAQGDNNG